jgi:16S rRNA (guanine527-N7)-methyltransferase
MVLFSPFSFVVCSLEPLNPFIGFCFVICLSDMESENKELLISGAKAFGIHLNEKDVEAFDLYLRELLKWNQKINLTAVRSEKGIILKHFLDSLSPYPYLSKSSSLLDIGSGAGFPGIPLKMVEPTLEVTLIDSVRKKIDFQKHIIRTLGLKGIEAIHGRVQEKEVLQSMGGRFEVVISRAFSDLQTLLILSFPFLKKGGIVLAMKGEMDHEEIRSLSKIKGTRYRLQKTFSLFLPRSSFKRSILLFEKE